VAVVYIAQPIATTTTTTTAAAAQVKIAKEAVAAKACRASDNRSHQDECNRS